MMLDSCTTGAGLLNLDTALIQKDGTTDATLFTDSGDTANPWLIHKVKSIPQNIDMKPRGGFLIIGPITLRVNGSVALWHAALSVSTGALLYHSAPYTPSTETKLG